MTTNHEARRREALVGEAAAELIAMRQTGRFEEMAKAVRAMPAALHEPIIFALIHRVAEAVRTDG